MGTVQSRFHELLLEGRVEESLLMWVETEQLQTRFDPKATVRGRWRDPPLHCLLRHGDYKHTQLKVLAQEFLEKKADPLLVNNNKETVLHIVCTSERHSKRVSQARRDVLALLMEDLPDGVGNGYPAWLELPDASQNTPLHLAAASGLLECVELLLARGAPLFAKNIAKQTPLDAAVEAKQSIIANFLESKMVFTDSDNTAAQDDTTSKSFYTSEQLKEMQSEVVRSVCSQLGLPEYAARALLSSYGWSAELVIDAFKKDSGTACQKAGIDLQQLQAELKEQRSISSTDNQCGICYDDISEPVEVPCGHHYCSECWTQYLEGQVKEGAGKDITCPGCCVPVPMEVTARLLSKELYSKYSDLALHQFVDSKLDIKWCPYPDCGQAVLLKPQHQYTAAVLGSQLGINTECGNGHGFCWNCMQHAHEPCECEVWDKWMKEIPRMAEAANVDLGVVAMQAEADAEWIVQNTKPCPNCKSPIQKNEGCNEMNCRKCRHNYCWVCLGPWREHGYRTGGYFTCNRYAAQRKANKQVEETRKSMTQEYRRSATETQKRQIDKFKFYYTRYDNHLLSVRLECQLLAESRARASSLLQMGRTLNKKVAKAGGAQVLLGDDGSVAKSVGLTNFLENITRGLLRARRILVTSYAIGYLIPDDRKAEREAHETLQGKLEEVVEILAQMVSRPHLNTPRSELIDTSQTVAHVCEEFLQVMRQVVLAGLKEDPPAPAHQLPPREEFVEVDPLVLFLHLAARNDPQFRDFWQQVLAEEAAEREQQQQN